jgi:hypothetical protein
MKSEIEKLEAEFNVDFAHLLKELIERQKAETLTKEEQGEMMEIALQVAPNLGMWVEKVRSKFKDLFPKFVTEGEFASDPDNPQEQRAGNISQARLITGGGQSQTADYDYDPAHVAKQADANVTGHAQIQKDGRELTLYSQPFPTGKDTPVAKPPRHLPDQSDDKWPKGYPRKFRIDDKDLKRNRRDMEEHLEWVQRNQQQLREENFLHNRWNDGIVRGWVRNFGKSPRDSIIRARGGGAEEEGPNAGRGVNAIIGTTPYLHAQIEWLLDPKNQQIEGLIDTSALGIRNPGHLINQLPEGE